MSQDEGTEPLTKKSVQYPWPETLGAIAALLSMVAAIAAAIAAYSANQIAENSLRLDRLSARPILEIQNVGGKAQKTGSFVTVYNIENRGLTSAKIDSIILTIDAVSFGDRVEPVEDLHLVFEGPLDGVEILRGGKLNTAHAIAFPKELERFVEPQAFLGQLNVYYGFADQADADKGFFETKSAKVEYGLFDPADFTAP